jgi:capsular polysaccharide biosynthesis protein
MLTLLPIAHALGNRTGLFAPRALTELARRTWELAPGETAVTPPAFFLPGQLDRVTGWAFADEHPGPQMNGGLTVTHAATRGFLLDEAWLLDGVLYKGGACAHLHPRQQRWPVLRADTEVERGAVYCTFGGNRYFGQWLMDDCPTYPLAAAEGTPVTTAQPVNPHTRDYEAWLDMAPTRLASAHFRELVVFEDVGQNRHKHARFRAMSSKLASRVASQPHPGVFVLRGRTGERRVLENELELAERLRARRGFRIVEPEQLGVPAIVAACAGARTVVGVEGSALLHGILLLPPGGAVVALQPPGRFVGLLKHLTDRDGQHFGFVVGTPAGDGFRVDGDELERTLDLLPADGV